MQSRSFGLNCLRVPDTVSGAGIASHTSALRAAGRCFRTPLLPGSFAVLYVSSFAEFPDPTRSVSLRKRYSFAPVRQRKVRSAPNERVTTSEPTEGRSLRTAQVLKSRVILKRVPTDPLKARPAGQYKIPRLQSGCNPSPARQEYIKIPAFQCGCNPDKARPARALSGKCGNTASHA